MIRKDELVDLLVRARKVITDQPGWEDDEECVALMLAVDWEVFGGLVPSEGRGAYDDGQTTNLPSEVEE